jgi:cell division protein FtsB
MPTNKQGLPARVKRLALALLRRFGALMVTEFGVARDDQLTELRQETARLGAASVESMAYLDADLHRLEENVRELREEVASLRRLIEERAPRGDAELAGPSDGG